MVSYTGGALFRGHSPCLQTTLMVNQFNLKSAFLHLHSSRSNMGANVGGAIKYCITDTNRTPVFKTRLLKLHLCGMLVLKTLNSVRLQLKIHLFQRNKGNRKKKRGHLPACPLSTPTLCFSYLDPHSSSLFLELQQKCQRLFRYKLIFCGALIACAGNDSQQLPCQIIAKYLENSLTVFMQCKTQLGRPSWNGITSLKKKNSSSCFMRFFANTETGLTSTVTPKFSSDTITPNVSSVFVKLPVLYWLMLTICGSHLELYVQRFVSFRD